LVSLTATGGLYARGHAAEPDTTPDKAWCVVRVLPGVGHQRPHRRGDHRLTEHAPAGVGDKLDAEGFGRCHMTGLTGRFMHSPATGHDYRDIR
jgi:hypothetical protein